MLELFAFSVLSSTIDVAVRTDDNFPLDTMQTVQKPGIRPEIFEDVLGPLIFLQTVSYYDLTNINITNYSHQ